MKKKWITPKLEELDVSKTMWFPWFPWPPTWGGEAGGDDSGGDEILGS